MTADLDLLRGNGIAASSTNINNRYNLDMGEARTYPQDNGFLDFQQQQQQTMVAPVQTGGIPSTLASGDDTGGWTCPTCTYFNQMSSYLACEICGETKPAPQLHSSSNTNDLGEQAVDAEHQRRMRERESQVEKEHQALVNERLEEIIELQHKLFADHEAAANTTTTTNDSYSSTSQNEPEWLVREREEQARLLREHEEREQQVARLEKEQERIRLEEEQIREREARLVKQRQELEQLRKSITTNPPATNASDNATNQNLEEDSVIKQTERLRAGVESESTSRPGATAIAAPRGSEAVPSPLDRKYERLDQERQQLEQQRVQNRSVANRPGATSVPGLVSSGSAPSRRPGATAISGQGSIPTKSPEQKFEKLEQERQQLLRQQQEHATRSRPGAMSVVGDGASSKLLDRKFERMSNSNHNDTNQMSQSSLPSTEAVGQAPQDSSSVFTSLTSEQQRSQVQLLLQAQRQAAVRQQQATIPEPSLVSSTRTLPPTPVRILSSRSHPQGATEPSAPATSVRQIHQPVPNGRSLLSNQGNPRRSGQPGGGSSATSSSLPVAVAEPMPPQEQHQTPTPRRKSRAFGSFLKRPGRASRSSSEEDLSSTEFDAPLPPAPTGGRKPRQNRGPLRNSVADSAIADLDRLMDDVGGVWEKTNKTR